MKNLGFALRTASLLALGVPFACSDSGGGSNPQADRDGGAGRDAASTSSGGASAGGAGAGGGAVEAGGASGTGGDGAGGAPVAGCAVNADCIAQVPVTTPAGCAEGTCEPTTRVCTFDARDADGDGHRALVCATTDPGKPVGIGDDCDDGDAIVNPAAWDGPADGANPDRCGDGIDQDCDTVDGNDEAINGATCECTLGHSVTCSEDSGGIPITWPTGAPIGNCRYGVRICEADPVTGEAAWGPCIGAVSPGQEFCNGGIDDNCRGNGDDDAIDKVYWRYDGDGDLHAAAGWEPVHECGDVQVDRVPAECESPGPTDGGLGDGGDAEDAGDAADGGSVSPACPPDRWRLSIPIDDCDDSNGSVFPGGTEVCDGLDNDCNTLVDDATTATNWYYDADGDRHVVANAPPRRQCPNPGLDPANCPGSTSPCASKWLAPPDSFLDCDDGNPNRYPSNWDGPGSLQVGIASPGWAWERFTRDASTNLTPPAAAEAPASTGMAPSLDRDWGAANGDYWVERWRGTLVVATSGRYTFHATSADGVRVWIGTGATALIDDWVGTGSTRTASRNINAGSHPIRVEYFEDTGVAQMSLEWAGPAGSGVVRQVLREVDDASHPARCDGIDQNCTGGADDEQATSAGSARSCTMQCPPGQVGPCGGLSSTQQPNVGTCRNGVRTCGASGVWGTCTGSVEVTSETCDGLDNNCNGQVDDGESVLRTFYYDGDQDNYCSGATTQACADPDGSAAQWKTSCTSFESASCDGASDNHPGGGETCDGRDNNCGGGVDEGNPGGNVACSTGQAGVCSGGTRNCVSGALQCTQNTGASGEVCDGQDNNCNGSADESFPQQGQYCTANALGACACNGWQCTGGSLTCSPSSPYFGFPGQFTPSVYTCPGNFQTWDWNCDGTVEVDDSWIWYLCDPASVCGRQGSAGACNQGNPANIGQFWVYPCCGLCSAAPCGEAVTLQQCWWSSSQNRCMVGASDPAGTYMGCR